MPSNPLCHFELMVSDLEKAKAFYSTVFDWSYENWDGPIEYTTIKTGREPGGGMMRKPDEAPHPALSSYFLVDDVDATLDKARSAGATVIVQKMEIPELGWHAMFVDPDGIPIGIFQNK